MRKLLFAILFLPMLGFAQSGERFQTKKGTLEISPILHGSFAMTWNGLTILNDPYGGTDLYESFMKPDIVFITDIHGDHLNFKTLDSIGITETTTIIAPKAVVEKLKEHGCQANIVEIGNGEKTKLNGIKISAIPMYNLPESEDSRHTKGRGNGYVIDMGGKRIYISGDTEDIAEMRALKKIDIAFVCMNLPYTMDVKQAASAVIEFKPKVIYPFHFRGKGGLSDINMFKTLVEKGTDKVEVRLRKWYPQQEMK